MFKTTVSELAAFSVCGKRATFLRMKAPSNVKPSQCNEPRLVGSFVHATLDRKAKSNGSG
jgi:hypothetical protein